MPVYNQSNLDFDIESIRRFGRVTVLQGNSGTVTCDVTKYSPLFVPRLSDHKGRVLLQTYKVGDRVSFFPKKADIPEKGCKYVTYKMSLVDENGCPEPLRSNVEGHVAFINDHFGFVRYDKTGKAYFHRDTALTDKSSDLRDVFPLHSRVVFDVHAQPPKNGCQYRAENLRILNKQQQRQNGDQMSQHDQASDELDELFHDCDFRDVEEIFSPSNRTDQQAASRFADERETNRFYSRGRGRMAASRVEPDFLDSKPIAGPKFDYNSAVYSSLENLSSVSNPRYDSGANSNDFRNIDNNNFLDRRRTAGDNGAGSSAGSAVSASIILTAAASGGDYRSTTSNYGRHFSLEKDCQTDKLSEMSAIRKILEDDEISQLISQKFLTEFRVLMRSKLK